MTSGEICDDHDDHDDGCAFCFLGASISVKNEQEIRNKAGKNEKTE
jgi:hypothetical protein